METGAAFSHYINDPVNIYLITFVVFVLIAYRLLRKPVAGWLDGEIAKVQEELSIAKDLHLEAEQLLKDCKAKQEQAEIEAARLLEKAKVEVVRLRDKAEADIAATIKRQEAAAAERIKLYQDKTIKEVRAAALHMGLELAKKKIHERLSAEKASTLIDTAIEGVPEFRKIG